MRLILKKCGELARQKELEPLEPPEAHLLLKVVACAVCRADAKMWQQGHRDLKLPRVLGHEIIGMDQQTEKLYAVWPGQACGECRYCLAGRENLCEEMRIIGFHSDGGFADRVLVPVRSCIPVQEKIDPFLLTFAEPVACVFNALSCADPDPGQRVVIYGAGVMGMVASLVLRELGLQVCVIERSAEKIRKLQDFAIKQGISLCKDTVEADFDFAMNCCSDHVAFSLCITKLCKGGRLLFFSGLTKNKELDTNLLNLIHYKELEIYGSYGPRRDHMVQAVAFCCRQQAVMAGLVEKRITLAEVETILPKVLDGQALKYIVDIQGGPGRRSETLAGESNQEEGPKKEDRTISESIDAVIRGIAPLPPAVGDAAQKKVDLKTKPLGALGKIETLAVQLSTIQNDLNPRINQKKMFVFAGDHGVVEEGVSAFPAKVTVQMVENFLDGGAAINTFCNQYDIDLKIVDMGVNGDFSQHPLLLDKKIAHGTENMAIRPAMNRRQAVEAIENGMATVLDSMSEGKGLVGLGEMGIGNTTSATAIIAAATGRSPRQLTGRGTGVDNKGLERKIEVIEKALDLHFPGYRSENGSATDGLELLQKIGGYELAGICGAVLAAASLKHCVVLDGIISTAAGLLACLICPGVKEYLVSGHKSVELGQVAALELMGLKPVLDLDFRLGEGTGAAITMNLVELSCRMMREMASFEEAGVDSGSI